MLEISAHVVGLPVEETALGFAPVLTAAVALAVGYARSAVHPRRRRRGDA
jgi:hypothetical protein